MTVPTPTPTPTPTSAPTRVSLAGTVRSELTKLRSVRSTAWSLLVTVALIVAVGGLACLFRAVNWPPRNPADAAGFDPAAVSMTGVYLAQFAIGVLGALVVTAEYATGTIRATFTAVPRRLPVLWAKVIAFALTVPALCLPAILAAFFIGQSVLSRHHIEASFGDPGVARAVAGSALYLTAVGILGLGLGALLRNTAAAVSALVGLLFLLPVIAGFLPAPWSDKVVAYLPMPAGMIITNAQPDPGPLGPWSGLGMFCLYAVVALALAAWQLRRRDA